MKLTPKIQATAHVTPLTDGVWEWEASNGDPQFSLTGLEQACGKWLLLEVEIRHESDLTTPAVIYIDTGAGFSERETIVFYPRGTVARHVLRLPQATRALRFDPTAQDGRFRIAHFSARLLSKAGLGMLTSTALLRRYGKQLPQVAAKAWRLQRSRGIKSVLGQIVSSFNRHHSQAPVGPDTYQHWRSVFETPAAHYAILSEAVRTWACQPLISVVMPSYNTPEKWLIKAIESVQAQIYPNWELCIADDASTKPHVRRVLERFAKDDSRIKLIFREKNGHISNASNSALKIATGEFVALLDHDDELHPLALYRVVEAIISHPNAELIYSDEDKINDQGKRFDPYFKCQLNYELLLAQNMVCHLAVYRRSTLTEAQGFRIGYEGAQDYDLVLRIIEGLDSTQIIHIPHVLYHWRAIQGSTALDAGEKNYAAEAARRAVSDHLRRVGIAGEVVPAPEAPAMNRVVFERSTNQPLVSILIPTRDRADLLGMCIDSILERSTYKNFEIIVIDNGSHEAETFALFDRLPKASVRILRDESPFNFSALNNRAAGVAKGEYLCLLNNDIEILTPDWLEEMLSFATRPGIGAVGARLWYPDGRLQHGGVILGVGGVAGHAHKYLPRGQAGYFGRAVLHQSFSAVTAACLLIRADIYSEVSGLDESLAVAFNDIDFCLRVGALGYRHVWTPYAEMNHHESASRGEENSPEKQIRFNSEILKMVNRWGKSLICDPKYSPSLSLEREDFSISSRPNFINNRIL